MTKKWILGAGIAVFFVGVFVQFGVEPLMYDSAAEAFSKVPVVDTSTSSTLPPGTKVTMVVVVDSWNTSQAPIRAFNVQGYPVAVVVPATAEISLGAKYVVEGYAWTVVSGSVRVSFVLGNPTYPMTSAAVLPALVSAPWWSPLGIVIFLVGLLLVAFDFVKRMAKQFPTSPTPQAGAPWPPPAAAPGANPNVNQPGAYTYAPAAGPPPAPPPGAPRAFCASCGAKLGGSPFCESCGARVT